MKGMIASGLAAVVIISATAILVGAKHEEYNRYEFHAVAASDRIGGYRMDKRTGEIVALIGKTIILTEWLDPHAEFSRPDPYAGIATRVPNNSR